MLTNHNTLYPNFELRLNLCPSVQAKRSNSAEQKYLNRLEGAGSENPESAALTLLANLRGISSSKECEPTCTNQIGTKLKPGYGLLSAKRRPTVASRRKCLRVGALLDKSAKRALFCTFTLPGSTREAIFELAKWTGYIMKRVNDFCSRHHGLDEHWWISSWELQKRGALHLHYCLIGSTDGLKRLKAQLKLYWCLLLQEISAKSGIDLFARKNGGTWANKWQKVQVDIDYVRKSVGAYLSKYLSKSGQTGKRQSELMARYPNPSRWAGCSRSLARKMNNQIQSTVTRLQDNQAAIALQEQALSLAKELGCVVYRIRSRDNCSRYAVYGEGVLKVYQYLEMEGKRMSEQEKFNKQKSFYEYQRRHDKRLHLAWGLWKYASERLYSKDYEQFLKLIAYRRIDALCKWRSHRSDIRQWNMAALTELELDMAAVLEELGIPNGEVQRVIKDINESYEEDW